MLLQAKNKNFLKKKTLNEIIHQDVGFLSHFTKIYIGKQTPYVLKKIKKYLKKIEVKLYIQVNGT